MKRQSQRALLSLQICILEPIICNQERVHPSIHCISFRPGNGIAPFRVWSLLDYRGDERPRRVIRSRSLKALLSVHLFAKLILRSFTIQKSKDEPFSKSFYGQCQSRKDDLSELSCTFVFAYSMFLAVHYSNYTFLYVRLDVT